MLSAIICTHASLARALREAVESIAGEVPQLETISNEGLTPDQVAERVREAVTRLDGDGCIVFADLSGGSCATSCVLALREVHKVRVLAGVNLPMLVDFALRRADLDLDAMVERLLQRGQASIQELKRPAPKGA